LFALTSCQGTIGTPTDHSTENADVPDQDAASGGSAQKPGQIGEPHDEVYFAGHDHHREWLEPTCGTSFIVSGAASKLRDVTSQAQATRYQDGKTRGFLWVEVEQDMLTGRFYDESGQLNYEDLVLR
jgi:hypothetical protein